MYAIPAVLVLSLGKSDAIADCTEFINFMLQMIDAALNDVLTTQGSIGTNAAPDVGINVGITNEAETRRESLLALVKENPTMTTGQMAEILGLTK